MVIARLLRPLGLAVAAAAVVAAIPATASMAVPGHQAHPGAALVRARTAGHESPLVTADGAYDQCRTEVVDGVWSYCAYKETDGRDLCVSGVDDLPNWNELGCRNLDESMANVSGFPVRVYYEPNWQGAWACLNNGWYSNDLNKDVYTFSSGKGDAGYGQEIWENIASSAQATGGSCSNPLPEDG
jgi:hypothetical protein